MFYVRNALSNDVDQIYSIILNSNILGIPKNKHGILKLIEKSIDAFSETNYKKENPKDYLFVLIDSEVNKIIGVSLIYGRFSFDKHPYHFFKVVKNGNASASCFKLTKLDHEWSGLGGLFLAPEYHSNPYRLGQVIAWCRFLYIGMKQQRFYDKFLSILMSPYKTGSINHFWNLVGKPQTGLDLPDFLESYKKSGNKADDFIKDMFSIDKICLDPKQQSVNPTKDWLDEEFGKKARRIIEFQSFDFINSVDFDGGIMYCGIKDQIPIIKNGKKIRFQSMQPENSKRYDTEKLYIGHFPENAFAGGRFEAVLSNGEAYISNEVMHVLGINDGDEGFVCTDEQSYIKNGRKH